MKAAVLYGVNESMRIEEIQIDRPGPREVLIRTGASSLCRSDLHYIEGRYYSPKPEVMGHEASGTVEAVGDQVTYVRPGDRVITCISIFCGFCKKCMSGRPVQCTNRSQRVRGPREQPRLSKDGALIHQNAYLGAYAEQMLVPENGMVKVDDDLPFEVLALIGCGVTTGMGAVLNTARIEPGSTVAVIGCGGVGLSCVQGAVIGGAGRIIAIDPVETKLTMARDFGATDVVDASGGGVIEKIRELTGGGGVDYSFDAIGLKETAEQSYEMLDSGGTATIVGMIPEGTKIEIDGPSFVKERRIQGCNMGSNRFRVDMPRYIEYYRQGRLKLDEMVSKRISLEQVNEGFDFMRQGHVARSVITFQ